MADVSLSRRLRHGGELALFLGLRGALRALPGAAARPVGAALGELLWTLGVRRSTVARNLELVFPDRPAAERRRLARSCYRHFGAMTCDTIAMSRLDAVELCRRLTLVGWERLDAAESHRRGVIVLSAHLGNWEVAARPIPSSTATSLQSASASANDRSPSAAPPSNSSASSARAAKQAW
jgi:lauroyl/myristoyl acyltransferase